MSTVSEKANFIQKVFGSGRVGGNNITVWCPVCASPEGSKKKLSIRLDDDVNHCWVCGWGARTLLPLIIKYGTAEEVHEYREKFLPEVIDVTKYKTSQETVEADKILAKLPSDFKLLAFNTKTRDPDVKSVKRYVESRGITERELWYWRIGTSNDPALRRRAIIPSFDSKGALNYYVARAIDKVSYMKYTNADGDSIDIIFNELNIDWSKRLTIVEGAFDLIKCRGNATCVLGSNISEKSALFTQLLIHETPVVLALDNDMQGKTQKIAKFLKQYNIDVWIAQLGNKKDPGEMTFAETDLAIANAQPWTWKNFLTFKLNHAASCSLGMKKPTFSKF